MYRQHNGNRIQTMPEKCDGKSFSCKISANENVTVIFHACFESSMDCPNKSYA